MTTIYKFYLHDATTTVGGTLPGSSSISATSPTVTATGASTNRTANGTIGVAQATGSLTTSATKSAQYNWFRRFISAPIAAQTISAQILTMETGYSQSNTNSTVQVQSAVVGVWRPSDGSLVGLFADYHLASLGDNLTSTQTYMDWLLASSNTSQVVALDGDVLVFEVWFANTQAMATGYTNTYYYDGTTEDSLSDEAAHIDFANAITMYSAPAADEVPRPPRVYPQLLAH